MQEKTLSDKQFSFFWISGPLLLLAHFFAPHSWASEHFCIANMSVKQQQPSLCAWHKQLKATPGCFIFTLKCRSEVTPENYRKYSAGIAISTDQRSLQFSGVISDLHSSQNVTYMVWPLSIYRAQHTHSMCSQLLSSLRVNWKKRGLAVMLFLHSHIAS
jgi:hypothetical protein